MMIQLEKNDLLQAARVAFRLGLQRPAMYTLGHYQSLPSDSLLF